MLVSIIIPCFNVGNYIVECLESCIAQTHNDIEIICVDNNSTDNTLQVLQQFKERFSNLIIDSELKPGANAARNKGLLHAKGQWIQFLDADDLLAPFKIEHQLTLIKNNKNNIGYIAGASKKIFVNGREILNSVFETDNFTAAFFNKSGNTCANLWNKTALAEIGNWNENIKSSQETDLMLRLAISGFLFLRDNEPLTLIRERENGQISQGNQSNKWKQYIDIRLNYLDKLKKVNKEVYQKYKGIYYDFLMVSLLTLAKHNQAEAVEIYTQSIRNKWASSGAYGFNKFKVALIKFLGFKTFLKFYKV